MARIKNLTPRLISLPLIACEVSGESMNGYNLPPGETVVEDDYIRHALGLGDKANLYTIRGEQNGHKGIKNLFLPKLKILELEDGDEAEPLFADLSKMSAAEAVEAVKSCTDKPTIFHWLQSGESRKTVAKALSDQAESLGLDIDSDPK